MEDSNNDIIIYERIKTEEAEYLYSITLEAWKATLKTPEFDRSKHHPFGESVYVLPKTLSTKLDDTTLQVVEFIFSTTAKDNGKFVVDTQTSNLTRSQLLSLKDKNWLHSQVLVVNRLFLNNKEVRKEVVKRIVFP
ncbi:unnamed protein product [Linum trigynum]|uniref:Uncharacterized protein n=1 Tax=Linum trigynum TaxID=586398 RepID=A0AAV2G959_9ROSI